MLSQVFACHIFSLRLFLGIVILGYSFHVSAEDSPPPYYTFRGFPSADQMSCADYAQKAVAQADTLRRTYPLSGNVACKAEAGMRWWSLHDEYKLWCEERAETPEKINAEFTGRAKTLLHCFNTIYPQAPAELDPEYLRAEMDDLGYTGNRATTDNDVEKLKLAFAYGAPLDWGDYSMNSEKAMDIAAGRGNLEASIFLLGIGSNAASVYDGRISTTESLLYPSEEKFPEKHELLSLFLSHGAGVNYLTTAVNGKIRGKRRDLKSARILLDYGADPNKSQYGDHNPWNDEVPLHMAARTGDIEYARLLLRYKANPYLDPAHFNMRFDAQKHSPLLQAVHSKNLEMVTLLLKANFPVSVHTRTVVLPRAVWMAALNECGSPRYKKPGTILHLLLQHGAVLDIDQGRWCSYTGD